MPGIICRTIMPAAGPIAGARTAWRGICDDRGRLCLALALWNGRDAILKERLFGLTNGQGNHGEDVKELYYYLDATPTHSYSEDALQVSAASVSLRAAGRREQPPRPRAARNLSCSTRAFSTTIAISMCSSNMPRRRRPTF